VLLASCFHLSAFIAVFTYFLWTRENKLIPTVFLGVLLVVISLVAFNLDLSTDQEKIASSLAKTIRQSSGGFQYIQAGPAFLEKYHHMQVTMNILDYTKNPIYRILEVIRFETKRYHVDVMSTEIIGLVPKQALLDSVKYYLQVNQLPYDKNMDLITLSDLSIQYLQFRDFNQTKIIEYWL
jgi:glutamate formiminotransferase